MTDNQNHAFNTRLDVKLDSTLLLNIRPAFSYGNSRTSSSNTQETFNANNQLTNSSEANTFTENERRNFRNRMDLTKRFGSKGSF